MSIAKTSGNFLESEVMRSLEKVAIKRGLVEPATLDKAASTPNKLESTGDVHADLINLVASLRERGYETEANALEDKIHIYKMAKNKYKKLCDEKLVDTAHPGGDAEVATSAEDYGKVETITSTQKKILDKIRKIPTGKLASAAEQMQDMLKVADNISFADVKHSLQDVVYKILQTKEVDNVVWGGMDEWYATDSGEAEHIANMAAPDVHDFITQKQEDFGVDPVELLGLIKTQALKYYTRPGPWGNLADEDVIDFKALLQAMFGGIIPLMSLTTAVKEKAKREMEKSEEGKGSGKPAKKEDYIGFEGGFPKNLLQKTFGYLYATAKALKDIVDHPDASPEARQWANEELTKTNRVRLLLSREYPKSGNEDFKANPKGLVNAIRSGLRKKVDIEPDLPGIEGWARQWYQDHNLEVEASATIYDLIKMAQDDKPEFAGYFYNNKTTPKNQIQAISNNLPKGIPPTDKPSGVIPKGLRPKGDKTKPKTTGKSPGDYLGIKIQQELKNLANAYEKLKGHKPDYVSKMRNTGAPGFGVLVRAGLGAAENVRKHVRAKNVPKIEQQRSPATLKNLQTLTAYISKGGTAEESLGTYKGTPLTRKNLITPGTFYTWAINNGYLTYQSDASGNEYFVVENYTDLLSKVRKDAIAQVQVAESEEDRKIKLKYARAVDGVWQKYSKLYKDWVNKFTRSGKKEFPKHMPVSALSGGVPANVGGPGQSEQKSPYGRIAINDAGQLASAQPIEFISDGIGSIGAGFPAKDFPPITRYIDLSSKWWEPMPETDILDYANWKTADAASIAGSMFGNVDSWPQYIKNSVNQAIQQNAAAIQQNPEIANQLYGQAARAAFRDFLRRLAGKISQVRAEYSDSVKNPNVRRKLVTRSNRDAHMWINMLKELEDELQRGTRSRRRR